MQHRTPTSWLFVSGGGEAGACEQHERRTGAAPHQIRTQQRRTGERARARMREGNRACQNDNERAN